MSADTGDPPRPRLRAVELLALEVEGERAVLLRDPTGMVEKPLLLAPTGAFLATRFDGEHTLEELREELFQASGQRVPLEQVSRLHRMLEREGWLEGERFEARRSVMLSAWRAAAHRPATHAGRAYPADREELQAAMGGWYADGPGAAPQPGAAELRGIIAPHVAPDRGGPVFARAYHALIERASDADLFVLVGTSHAPCSRVALTAKSFATPFGRLTTDADAVARIAAALPGDAYADELNHRFEHSLEFQAVFLAHALVTSLGAERLREVRIVPLLVGSFHDLLSRGARAEDDPRAQGAVDGLREVLASHRGRTVVIAGVDLAHVGRRFGGGALTAADLPSQEARDRRFLELAVAGDADGLWADVAADEDASNYCGFPPLWVVSRILGAGEGRLLDYGQDLTDGAVVSFAAAAL